ncbi:MAG TPA: DUF4382 domain-containing protein [Geobacteraceae bacterium]
MRNKYLAAVGTTALLLALLLTLLQLPGCGSNGGTQTGTLQVALTDAPTPTFSDVVITINEVRAVPAGMENRADHDPGLPLIVRFTTPLQVHVLDFHFLQQFLGEAVIPAGRYNQIRLILAQNVPGQAPVNYVIPAGSTTQTPIDLTTPSGQQSGVKIVGQFTVTAGAINAVVIDFNPDTAIVTTGNGKFNLKPTGIRINQVASLTSNFGSISGTIRSSGFTTWSSATVSVAPRATGVPTGSIAAGTVFSNFSSPSVWKAPFEAFVPPTNSTLFPVNVSYRVFVSAGSKFQIYSSPLITNVSQGVTTQVPPNGIAPLTLAP